MSVSLPEFSYLNLLTQKQQLTNEKKWSENDRFLFAQCILCDLVLPISNFPHVDFSSPYFSFS